MYHPQEVSAAQPVSPAGPATLQLDGQGYFPVWLPAIDPELLAIVFVVIGLVILALGLLSQVTGAARGLGVVILVLSLAVLVVGGSPFLLGSILGIVGGLWGIRSKRPTPEA